MFLTHKTEFYDCSYYTGCLIKNASTHNVCIYYPMVANEFLHAVKFLQGSTFLILIGNRIPPSIPVIGLETGGGGPSGLAISHQLKFSKMFNFFQYFQ
jgi:hypothetical protein